MRKHLKILIFALVVLAAMMATHTEAAKPSAYPPSVPAQNSEPTILSFTGEQFTCLSYHLCAKYEWTTANAVRVRIMSGYIDETTGKFRVGGWFKRRVGTSGTYSDFMKIGNDAARLCIMEPLNSNGRKTCKVVRPVYPSSAPTVP